MSLSHVKETFGFRYPQPGHVTLCNLHAVGRDIVEDPSYRWDGLTRTDGPMLLFQYTLDGEGMLESDGKSSRIGPGRAMMLNIPGNHVYYFPEDSESWTFIFALISPTLIQPIWEEARKKLGETPYFPQTSKPIRLLHEIFEEAYAGRITDSFTASSWGYQLVTELCRFATIPQGDRRDWPAIVRQMAQYFETHYAQMIGLDTLAEELQLSKYHLIRTFSAAVGITPNEYLNKVRIEQAMRLLRHSDLSVEQIAERVGYSSGSYFIKVFRKITGITPGRFRSGQEQITVNRLFFN